MHPAHSVSVMCPTETSLKSETPPTPEMPIPAIPATCPWHALPRRRVMQLLCVDTGGLGEADVAARRAVFGANRLPRRGATHPVIVFLRQFKNPLIYLLLVATLVSIAVAEWADAFFIFVVIQLNAVIGAYQEARAEASADALRSLVQNYADVVRDGFRRRIAASDLVPGDIVRLDSGTLVPADLRLLAVTEVLIDESLLTGESMPVEKDVTALSDEEIPVAERRNMLFAGSTVLAGRITGVVTATAADTEIGRIAEALAHGDMPPPPLVADLERFGRVIGVATLLLIGLIAAVQLAQGLPLVTVFLVAVALAVAAIPEGLPVAITVALAIATNRMARRNVIVRALPAVEGLGACTLIASDKTGTLTCNELTVKRVLLFGDGTPDAAFEIGGEGYRPDGDITIAGNGLAAGERSSLRRLARSGALCNEASLHVDGDAVDQIGDTVDVAFLVLAAKLGMTQEALQTEEPQVALIPYEPHSRFGAVFTRCETPANGREAPDAVLNIHAKGSAEVVLPMCASVDRDAALAAADRMAADGYRVLAVARGTTTANLATAVKREALRDLDFLGLVGLIDPVRPEVPAAVASCRAAGIDVRMVTGDHPSTALAIARQLGIGVEPDDVVTGARLSECVGEAFDRCVNDARIFARIEPIQKLSIVKALQRGGHVVAVSGDGVNDAPALSTADIGVAMGKGGTDAAREAADLVLADDNFASIVAGVEEGRIAYDNVRKLIFLLIATGLGEIVLFLFAIAVGLPPPLFAVQLLWLNLVTNGIQDIALAFEKGEPGVLGRRPRRPDKRLFNRRMIVQVMTAGIFMGTVAFGFYLWLLETGVDETSARNLVLLLMVLFENVHALNARSETRSVFRVPFAGNPFLIVAIIGAQLLHIVAMHVPWLSGVLDIHPIAWTDWLLVAAIAVSLLAAIEVLKWLTNRGDRSGRYDLPS